MDTQKMLSLVDVFAPFLPLEREHVRVRQSMLHRRLVY